MMGNQMKTYIDMRIYRQDLPSTMMFDSTSLYARQIKGGLLCWSFDENNRIQSKFPSATWSTTTNYKEPSIISNFDKWVSVWEPLEHLGGFTQRNLFRHLQMLRYDIDALYYDDFFWSKQRVGVTELLRLLPMPVDESTLLNVIHTLADVYSINLQKDYWFNQRYTIHFWTKGLLNYIGSLQYQIGLDKLSDTNSIIRKAVPSLSLYMDNRHFWASFFKQSTTTQSTTEGIIHV